MGCDISCANCIIIANDIFAYYKIWKWGGEKKSLLPFRNLADSHDKDNTQSLGLCTGTSQNDEKHTKCKAYETHRRTIRDVDGLMYEVSSISKVFTRLRVHRQQQKSLITHITNKQKKNGKS